MLKKTRLLKKKLEAIRQTAELSVHDKSNKKAIEVAYIVKVVAQDSIIDVHAHRPKKRYHL